MTLRVKFLSFSEYSGGLSTGRKPNLALNNRKIKLLDKMTVAAGYSASSIIEY